MDIGYLCIKKILSCIKLYGMLQGPISNKKNDVVLDQYRLMYLQIPDPAF